MISAISGFRILAHAVVEAICDPTWLMGHLLRQIRFHGSIGQRHLFYLSFCPFNNGTGRYFYSPLNFTWLFPLALMLP